MVVLLGDFSASHKFKTRSVAPEVWAEALAGLKAPLGVHAILGNHDWWDDRHAQRTRQGPVLGRRMLERVGIPVYENDATRLVKDGRRFWLAGLGDQLAFIRGRRKARRRKFHGVDDLDGTLAKVTDERRSSCWRTSPTSSRACPHRVSLTLCRPHPRRPGARARLSRRWSPRASATATPTATSSRTTAT